VAIGDKATISIRVAPRSNRNVVRVDEIGDVKVWVTAAPTDGQANAATCELIAKKLGLSKSAVSVVRGEASRTKAISVVGMSVEEALQRLRS